MRLVPRETKFYDMFVEMAENLISGAKVMAEVLGDFNDVPERVRQLKEIEKHGDDMTHAVILKLNQTFITPFDREDIHRLASTIDDVLDLLNAAGERLVMYKIATAPQAAHELAQIVVRQSEQISAAVAKLDKQDTVLDRCVEINRLENEADAIARRAIGALFDAETDPIALIKLKELYETLETATDKAEDVANVLESVVLKSA